MSGDGMISHMRPMGRGDRIVVDDPWADGEPTPDQRAAAIALFRQSAKVSRPPIPTTRLSVEEMDAAIDLAFGGVTAISIGSGVDEVPTNAIICTSDGEPPSTATAALMADWIRDELAKEKSK
jgi:hypothetical protein